MASPRKPLVYLAGPYKIPDPVENVHRTVKLANQMRDSGIVTPLVPHLSMLWHLIDPQHEQVWLDYDLEVLAHCNAVFRRQGESSGADAEVLRAIDLGIAVFFELGALYQWADAFAVGEVR